MASTDADEHWLWRHDRAEWLAAAETELRAAVAVVDERSSAGRPGRSDPGTRRVIVTHARRAAGMALNAVLVQWAAQPDAPPRDQLEALWGRSYVDHLQALADGAPLGPLEPHAAAARTHAAALAAIRVAPPAGALVSLRPTRPEDLQALDHAIALYDLAAT